MKSLFTSLVVLCFVTAGAQTNKDDVALLQSIYGKEKRALIAEYMTLSDSANALGHCFFALGNRARSLGLTQFNTS